MIDKEKAKLNMKVQWTKFIIVAILYLLFLYWVKSWLGLIVLPLIFDVYITKKIRWQWWRESEGPVRFVMSWVDALVFALVAVYFINLFFFQNYVIPSSSLEKSLLTGDYLFVSKMSYGPRKPNTPLTLPLTQHTLPLLECKSYIEWPQWKYERVKGFGQVKLNDIVVFNYPAGDTICTNEQWQAQDFYQMAYAYGLQIYREQYPNPVDYNVLNKAQQHEFFDNIYAIGRSYIANNPQIYGGIGSRPVDRRENYVKRCVGLPGQTLQIKNRIIYINGKANKEPDNVQYMYDIRLKTSIPEDLLDELEISNEDLATLNQQGCMPLTSRAAKQLAARKDVVESIKMSHDDSTEKIYPLNGVTGWTCDNYGPIWIPKKGETIKLTLDNIAIYERPIRVYEGHDLKVANGSIYIDGKLAKSYTFGMDYYWMMGDNRHNSLDSRYWGFVPEDHIVGKPIFIWWSKNPDKNGFSGVRWSRLFNIVDNIK